jgi:anti-sigma B factor antagonist
MMELVGGASPMSTGEAEFGSAVVVTPVGRIDLSNAEAFTGVVEGAVAKAPGAAVVDLSHVDFISSAGFRALTIGQKAAKSSGKAFAISNVTPTVQEVFKISRLDRVFSIYADVRDALAAVAPDALGSYKES